MRLKYTKLLALCAVTANVCLVYFTVKFFTGTAQNRPTDNGSDLSIAVVSPKPLKPRERSQSASRHIKNMVTIVFRDVYFFDNDLQTSIESVLNLIPNIQVLVVYDDEPYPSLEFINNLKQLGNVQFVSSAFDVFKTGRTVSPLNLIRSRYTLLVPDSWRLGGRSILQKMLREIDRVVTVARKTETVKKTANVAETPGQHQTERSNVGANVTKKMLLVPFTNNIRQYASCCRMHLAFANWTIEYVLSNDTTNCDMYVQKHGIFIETALLKDMPDPLMTPFPEMMYVQAKLANIQKIIMSTSMMDGKRLFTAFHNKKRKKEIRRQQFRDMYRRLQIKKVIRKVLARPGVAIKPDPKQRHYPIIIGGSNNRDHPNGSSNPDAAGSVKTIDLSPHVNGVPPQPPLVTSVEYYGCERNTPSCIGTVFNSRPFFVHMGRHTPPCCAEKLKAVVHHVLDELENVGIRYWLDNVALRGAIDSNGLSPDAFEVDISFIAFDMERSESLKKCQTRPLSDVAGFYWMKATDGHYFRVLFSKANQIGVNLLPFELEQDRVLPSGFYGWKAKEFSAEFLHPMSNVVFLGKNVMCPNNVKEFLAIKNL